MFNRNLSAILKENHTVNIANTILLTMSSNKMEKAKKWDHLYGVTCKNGNHYTGISTNILKRFETHCNEKGSKCLRGKGPLNYVV